MSLLLELGLAEEPEVGLQKTKTNLGYHPYLSTDEVGS